MHCNIGNSDRIIRALVGAIILAAGAFFKSWWGLIGIIPLATSLSRFCPFYSPLKINTGKKDAA